MVTKMRSYHPDDRAVVRIQNQIQKALQVVINLGPKSNQVSIPLIDAGMCIAYTNTCN